MSAKTRVYARMFRMSRMFPINRFFFIVCQGGQLTNPAFSAYTLISIPGKDHPLEGFFKSYCQGEIKCL
jgi:hypothetical protein